MESVVGSEASAFAGVLITSCGLKVAVAMFSLPVDVTPWPVFKSASRLRAAVPDRVRAIRACDGRACLCAAAFARIESNCRPRGGRF